MTGYQSKKAAAQDKLSAAPDNFYTIKQPEQSEWKCYMFGNTPQHDQGFVYIPRKGQEPNRFVRWMMKVCFIRHPMVVAVIFYLIGYVVGSGT